MLLGFLSFRPLVIRPFVKLGLLLIRSFVIRPFVIRPFVIRSFVIRPFVIRSFVIRPSVIRSFVIRPSVIRPFVPTPQKESKICFWWLDHYRELSKNHIPFLVRIDTRYKDKNIHEKPKSCSMQLYISFAILKSKDF